MKKFLSIAGNIGSGKSSLTKLLSDDFGWIPYYESVHDNPYLEDFYSDMNRWSFNLQIYFLSHRFRIHKEILDRKESVIQDRSIYEDVEIFAENLFKLGRMSQRDYDNYRKLFSEMVRYLKPPDLLIYLRANTDTLVNQIKLRGRDFEKNIEPSYLESLNKSYERWISEYNYGDYLIIDTDNLDFVSNESDLLFIKDKLQNYLK